MVEFGAAIKLDSRSALDQMRKFAESTTVASKTLKHFESQTRSTAQGLSGNIFANYIKNMKRVSVATENAVAKIHNQTIGYGKLTDAQKKLVSTVDRLNQKYDESARVESKLIQIRKELRLVVASGLKTQKEADAIFDREAVNIRKGTVAYKERIAEIKKNDKATKANNKSIEKMRIKYDSVYAAKKRDATVTKELTMLLRKGMITQSQYNKILSKQIQKTKQLARQNESLVSSYSRLGQAARVVSVLSRVLLGLYAVNRLATFIKDLEMTAERFKLAGQKLEYLTGDNQGLSKLYQMTQDVGIEFEAANKIITRFAVVTNRAFDMDTMNTWLSTLVRSGRAAGTSTQELNGAMIQITQAMSAGRLMGDEYRSVTENLPLYTVALRDMFGESTMSLKEMSSEGLLTKEVLVEGLDNLKVMLKGFPDSTKTVEASLGRLSSSWDNFIAKIMKTDMTKSSANYLAWVFNTYATAAETSQVNNNRELVTSANNKLKSILDDIVDKEKILSGFEAKLQDKIANGARPGEIAFSTKARDTAELRLKAAKAQIKSARNEIDKLNGVDEATRSKDLADKKLQEVRRQDQVTKDQIKASELLSKVAGGNSIELIKKKGRLLRAEIEASHELLADGKIGISNEEYFAAMDQQARAEQLAIDKRIQTEIDAELRIKGFKTKVDIEDIQRELDQTGKIEEINKKFADRKFQIESAYQARLIGLNKGQGSGSISKVTEADKDKLIDELEAQRARELSSEIKTVTDSLNSMRIAAETTAATLNDDSTGLFAIERENVIQEFNDSMSNAERELRKIEGQSINTSDALEKVKDALIAARDAQLAEVDNEEGYKRGYNIDYNSDSNGDSSTKLARMLDEQILIDEALDEMYEDRAEKLLAAEEENARLWGDMWANTANGVASGIGDAFADVLLDQQKFGESINLLMKQVAKSVISGLVQIGIKKTLLAMKSAAETKAITVASALEAKALALSWAPAAAATSLASFGSNSLPAMTGIAATNEMALAYALAGQAHDGMDNVPREGSYILDKGEMVLDKGTSQKVRDGVGSGGGVGDLNVTVSAMDAESFIGRLGGDDVTEKIWNVVLDKMNEEGRSFS